MPKVIITDKYVNKCKCGELVTVKPYMLLTENTTNEIKNDKVDNIEERYLGFCKCGNVFIA